MLKPFQSLKKQINNKLRVIYGIKMKYRFKTMTHKRHAQCFNEIFNHLGTEQSKNGLKHCVP